MLEELEATFTLAAWPQPLPCGPQAGYPVKKPAAALVCVPLPVATDPVAAADPVAAVPWPPVGEVSSSSSWLDEEEEDNVVLFEPPEVDPEMPVYEARFAGPAFAVTYDLTSDASMGVTRYSVTPLRAENALVELSDGQSPESVSELSTHSRPSSEEHALAAEASATL